MNILSNKLRNNNRILNHAQLIQTKQNSLTPKTELMEIHPTDNFNLN